MNYPPPPQRRLVSQPSFSSLRPLYPRLHHCDVTFYGGPTPPPLSSDISLPPPFSSRLSGSALAPNSVESSALSEMSALRSSLESADKLRAQQDAERIERQRKAEEERLAREIAEREAAEEAERKRLEHERKLREAEEERKRKLAEAEEERRRKQAELERAREAARIEYEERMKNLELMELEASLPPHANQAIQSFIELSGVEDRIKIIKFLTHLNFNVERAVQIYFDENNMDSALAKAKGIGERHQQALPLPAGAAAAAAAGGISAAGGGRGIASGGVPMCHLNVLLPNGTINVSDFKASDTIWTVQYAVITNTYLAEAMQAQPTATITLTVINGPAEAVLREADYNKSLQDLGLVPTGTIRVTLR